MLSNSEKTLSLLAVLVILLVVGIYETMRLTDAYAESTASRERMTQHIDIARDRFGKHQDRLDVAEDRLDDHDTEFNNMDRFVRGLLTKVEVTEE